MALDKNLLRLYLADTNSSNYAISDDFLDKLIAKAGGDDDENFNAILAEGWRIKAATVAQWYDASIDGRVFNRAQVFRHATKMAEMYAAEAGTSISNFEIMGPNNPAIVESDASEFDG